MAPPCVVPGPSRGGGRLGTEALHPRVPRRSQQVLAELSRELAELKTELEESKKSNPGA